MSNEQTAIWLEHSEKRMGSDEVKELSGVVGQGQYRSCRQLKDFDFTLKEIGRYRRISKGRT